MYRPTVRYADVYKRYVDDVFQATTLDRNQIIRLALFLLPHIEKGNEILNQHLKQNASLPAARWMDNHQWLWLGRQGKSKVEAGTSGDDTGLNNIKREEGRHESAKGYSRPISRQQGEIREGRTNSGGIRIVVG